MKRLVGAGAEKVTGACRTGWGAGSVEANRSLRGAKSMEDWEAPTLKPVAMTVMRTASFSSSSMIWP